MCCSTKVQISFLIEIVTSWYKQIKQAAALCLEIKKKSTFESRDLGSLGNMTSVRSFTKSCCLSYSCNRCKWELFFTLEQNLTSVGTLLFSLLLRNRMRTEVMAWDNRLEQSTLAPCRSNAHKYWGFKFTKILRIGSHTKTEDYNSYCQILWTGIHKDTGNLNTHE